MSHIDMLSNSHNSSTATVQQLNKVPSTLTTDHKLSPHLYICLVFDTKLYYLLGQQKKDRPYGGATCCVFWMTAPEWTQVSGTSPSDALGLL